jgi:hypothetical protein
VFGNTTWFWLKIVSLFRKWQTMADELSSPESTVLTSQATAESSGPVFPEDPDNRPIGRCYPQVMRVKQLIDQLRSTKDALGDAIAALGECRANARMAGAAADAAVTGALIGAMTNIIAGFDEDLSLLANCEACQPPEEMKAE